MRPPLRLGARYLGHRARFQGRIPWPQTAPVPEPSIRSPARRDPHPSRYPCPQTRSGIDAGVIGPFRRGRFRERDDRTQEPQQIA